MQNQNNRNGIAVAGNILTDEVKIIDSFPEREIPEGAEIIRKADGDCGAVRMVIGVRRQDG